MNTEVAALHTRRFRRMLDDLDISPAAVLVDGDLALWDAVRDRRISPPLANQTLAEGLASALRLATAYLDRASDTHRERAVGTGPRAVGACQSAGHEE